MKSNLFTIPAEVHSDDRAADASFDAAPWFTQATDDEILALAECGFRGDYPADEVAQWMADTLDAVADVFNYVCTRRKVADIGFECSVDETAARAWVAANRPALNLPE